LFHLFTQTSVSFRLRPAFVRDMRIRDTDDRKRRRGDGLRLDMPVAGWYSRIAVSGNARRLVVRQSRRDPKPAKARPTAKQGGLAGA
jgi:hypothetical protein